MFGINTYTPDPSAVLPYLSSLETNQEPLPPVVHHVEADDIHSSTGMTARALVMYETRGERFSEAYLDELADFGAVYRAPSRAEKPQRLESSADLDKTVKKGTYLRVHQHPVRRRGALGVAWAERLLVNSVELADWVAVDKPPRVPMQAGVDNRIENLQFQLGTFVGEKLTVTSRLDVCTSGASVLARSRRVTETINRSIRERAVRKEYLALVRTRGAKAPSVGRVDHLFRTGDKKHKNSSPTLLRSVHRDGRDRGKRRKDEEDPEEERGGTVWKPASLEILSCTRVEPSVALAKRLSRHVSEPIESKGDLYQLRIRLLTGRTHQIRLQLAAINAPVVGDSRYAPVAGLLEDLGAPHGDGSSLFGAHPECIALHCASLDFGNSCKSIGLTVVEALAPWWYVQEE